MVKTLAVFSGVTVDDLSAAKQFYEEVLGFKVSSEDMGLRFTLPGGSTLFIYEKSDHVPATYTYLNLAVENIDEAVDSLVAAGVVMEKYEDMPAKPDEKGILRGLKVNMGPDIAWFKDPAGNIISVLQDS